MATVNGFNFREFAIECIKTIDSIRSVGKTNANPPIESRINAFYRALGLPAINLSKKPTTAVGSQNNGNLFELSDLGLDQTSQEILKLRQRNVAYLKPVKQDEIDNFLDINDVKIDQGVNSEDNSNLRDRGTLFPMIVNNEIPIFPRDRRVGPAFSKDKDLKDDKIYYKRPLIETIISLKLKAEGLSNSTNQNKITLAVQKEVEKIGGEVLETLKESKNSIGEILKKSIDNLCKARKQHAANIRVIANSAPTQNPVTTVSDKKQGELDRKLKKQQYELETIKARLMIFDFDDTFGDDSANSITKNLKEPVLANSLIYVSINTLQISKAEKETLKKINKQKAIIKKAFRDVELILGTFSGLSGVDVLAVIIALFELDTGVLISLLNKKNRLNLKNNKGEDKVNGTDVSVSAALKQLEKKVTEVMKEISTEVYHTKYNSSEAKKEK